MQEEKVSLGKFHWFMPHKKRKPSLKKKVWDLEKFINYDKIPEEAKSKKL